MRRRYQVLLCGYYGMGNQGDELLAQSTLSLLMETDLTLEEIAMLSGNPDESRNRFGVASFHRWRLAEIWRAMRQSRCLLLGGGGLFQDATSWRSPWYYGGLIAMARCACSSVLALGQSVGPLGGFVAKHVSALALRGCKTLTVRDEASLKLCHSLGATSQLSPDLVLGLTPMPHRQGAAVLVNLRPWKDDLPLRAARAIQSWACEHHATLRGVAMAPEDLSLMQQLNDQGLLSLESLDLVEVERPFELFQGASKAFGMRLHFGVLSLLSYLDCQLVPYDPKISGFVQQWGGSLWNDGTPWWQPWNVEKLRIVRAELVRQFRDGLQEVSNSDKP